MSSQLGYDFHFTIDGEVLTLPITPEEVNIKSGSNNKTITLINEGEINLLKSPSLMEIEFEARFPMREYPYSRWKSTTLTRDWQIVWSNSSSKVWNKSSNFEHYFNMFANAKQNKQPVRFSIVRQLPDGTFTWGTGVSKTNEDNLFSIEDLETNESVDNGDDVIVTFKLKKYKPYGVIKSKIKTETPTSTSTSNTNRSDEANPNSGTANKEYVVKKGDCLWTIAKKHYGNGAKWNKIYDANKTIIEDTAKKHRGGKGSSNGHWIYPGTKLIIPKL